MRWRAARHADVGRVRDLAAIPADQPLWLRTFRTAYARAAGAKPRAGSSDGFMAVVEPILGESRHRVAEAICKQMPGRRPSSKDDQAALTASLEFGLRQRLYNLLAKTLVLELAVASRRSVLAGKTTEQRFAFFCDCLADPGFARALLEQYPVLIRRIATMVGNWENATLVLLSRLASSHHMLRRTFFNGDDPGTLLSAESAGDTHRGGQAVHILQFEAGGRLVYKPRSVALEGCFFDAVAWLNRNGLEPDLKEVRTLDQGGFGWMEFVDSKPCKTLDEVERFFVRQGAQLALAYVLGGTDLHSENVIAHGEYPVLVDLETLFQTPLLPENLAQATALGWRTLCMSVMGTLLLPQPMFLAEDENWIDLSALGHTEGQLTPYRVPVWRGDGTDWMRLLHQRISIPGGTSLPEYEGKRTAAALNVESIIRGLRSAYELLRSRKTELLSETGPLAAGLGNPARHVFRSTDWYARILDASLHPRHLEDSIAAEAFLRDRLNTGSRDTPWLSAIEDAEVADLMAGDIPYFASNVGGHEPLPVSEKTGKLPSNGWEEARARLRALSDADLDRQVWLVNVAMTDLGTAEQASRIPTEPASDPESKDLVATAARIGDRICELAIIDGERATWLTPTVIDKNRLMSNVAGLDLYAGLPGIALYLGYLGAITGDNRYGRVAAAAVAEAIALYKVSDSEALPLGAYEGVGGLSYALLHLATLLGRPEWIDEALEILQKGGRRAARSSQVDIISGQAGFIVSALAVYRLTQDARLLRGLSRLVERLYSLATTGRKRGRLALPTKDDAGMAHGRAGIAYALVRWVEETAQDECLTTAARLFRFDLASIEETRNETAKSQKALRKDASHLGWCRGSLGLALVALRTKHIDAGFALDEAGLQEMADEIVSTTGEGPLCLCHGALAQLEFVAAMADRGMLPDVQAAAAWRRRLLTRMCGGDWVADATHRLEAPGLMLGLAGTGFALLRSARPKIIPSVLTFES